MPGRKWPKFCWLPIYLSEGETRGEFENAYEWQAVITRVVSDDDEENLPVYQLNINVGITWHEGEKEKSFVIETLKVVKKEKGS